MDLGEIKRVNLIEYARDRWGLVCNSSGMALCPFHPDKKPSLSIFQTKSGSWRFKCFGCEENGSVIDFKMAMENLGKKEACSQLSKELQGPIKKVDPKILASAAKKEVPDLSAKKAAGKEGQDLGKAKLKLNFDYKDEAGEVVYRKVKYVFEDGTKDFRFKHPVEGKPDLWDWTKGKAGFIPYNLDKFKGEAEIIICEGEKDADTITRLKIGVLATSAPAGKGAWPDVLTPHFKDLKKTSFLYDVGAEKDARIHAEKLKKAHPEMEIFIVKVPLEKEGQDITDYLLTIKDLKQKRMALLDLLDKSEKFTIEEIPGKRCHAVVIADVELKPIRWLWDLVFPLAKTSLLVGDGGVGKSYFTNWMASRITTGRDWIDPEKKQPVGKVVIVTTEDGMADTIKLRAILMGADQKNLIVIDGMLKGKDVEPGALSIGLDLPYIEKVIREAGNVRLLVIDPITEFIGKDVDDHRAGPTRSALAPLKALAEKYNICVLILSHMNKDEAKKILYRTTGSQSYINVPRAAWAIVEDNEKSGRCFFKCIKKNLCKAPPTYAFSITDNGIILEKDPVKVQDGELFGTDDQKYERSQIEEAKKFLIEILERGPVRAKAVIAEYKQSGLSERTVNRAKNILGITSYRDFENGVFVWYWKLKGGPLV